MKKYKLFIFPMAALLVLLFYLVFSLPKLPPAKALNACTVCHWDKKDHPAHLGLDFAAANCLACHNPHTHFGKPYLPSIEACLICHFEKKPKPGHVVHKPARKAQCLSCHTRHKLFEKPALVAEVTTLCFVCHRDESLKYADPVGHMPYDKGQCLSCHDAHMSPYRAITRAPLDMLCQTCHRQWWERLRPVRHLPFERGRCLECHVPHVSAWDGLIRQSQLVLCYSCHFDRQGELKRPYKHGPYAAGHCTACHEPHASAGANLIPYAVLERFCYTCHEEMRRIGELGFNHARVLEDSCLGCHEHHAAGHGSLLMTSLSGNLFCSLCHVETGKQINESAHRVLACLLCHRIHGSSYPFLLPESEVNLCSRCHYGLQHRATNHPVGEPYRDILRNRILLCSSCHGPHGTRFGKMTVRGKNDLCLPCHAEIR